MTDVPTAAPPPAPQEDLASLVATAERAAQWSVTADKLKAQISRARLTAFALTMLGATAATVAGQIPAEHATLRNFHAGTGAVALALAAFVTGRLLTAERVNSWIRVRAAAEALKREAFRYAVRAEPFDKPLTAADLLDEARQMIETNVATVVSSIPDRTGSAPRRMLKPDEYRLKRIQDQIHFYSRKSAEAAKRGKAWRMIEFVLALAATVVTGLSTVTGKQIPIIGFDFDIAALTALLTTLGGAILTHAEASRLDHLATRYAAAARRLDDLDVAFGRALEKSENWSAFVNRCEDIIAAENQSWIAKWSPSSSARA